MSFGSVVGRFANRIAKGKFTLDGVVYNTPINNGPNTLHGGPEGWHSVVWDTEILKDSKFPAVKFTYVSLIWKKVSRGKSMQLLPIHGQTATRL